MTHPVNYPAFLSVVQITIVHIGAFIMLGDVSFGTLMTFYDTMVLLYRRSPGRGIGLMPAAKTVLVIEDEADIQRFISRVLELEGYKVLLAGDGVIGLDLLRNNPVSLVLLDLRLPGLDGW